jgi:hypothetical protein
MTMSNFCYSDFKQGDLLVRKWAPDSKYQITTWLFLKIRRFPYNEGPHRYDKMELDALCTVGSDDSVLMTLRHHPYEAVIESNPRSDFSIIRDGIKIWPDDEIEINQ